MEFKAQLLYTHQKSIQEVHYLEPHFLFLKLPMD